ncbi:uncharacterized protein [Periplaneta americana]|uniref:uncharacterized protein isoform X2 n=1 Tax=Periplaneta americana TaxID=6978 RepID=UPI0037E927FE
MLWDFEKETIYSSDVILRFTEAFNYENIMSGRSMNSSIIVTTGTGGSVRQHTGSGLPNGVKFAGEDSKDKMYEPKHTKKLIRVLTVVAYIFSVSLAAIMLSVYYVFLWNPRDIHHRAVHLTTPTPISSPGTACPQTIGASLQEQDKPQGFRNLSTSWNKVTTNETARSTSA